MAKKRVPTPGKNAVSSKGSKKSKEGKKNNTATTSLVKAKDENKTVFNSSVDNNLIVKDAYGDLGETINSMYKFTTTINLDTINSVLKGGLGSLNKITSYLKEANAIKDAFQSGNIMDGIGKLAPGAKAALTKAGMDPALFDKFQAAAQVGVQAAGTYKKIKNGDVDLLTGLNDLAKSITGVDLAVIKDIQSIQTAVAGIIKEFSDAGIAIKNEWDKLTKSDKNGYNVSTDVAVAILPDLAANGDFETMLAAINSSDPQRLNKIGPDIIKDLISNYSASAIFNKGRNEEDIYNDIFRVIKAFQGGKYLWIEREGMRHLFNMYLFMNASEDFKKMTKVVLSRKFFMGDKAKNTFNYEDEMNEVLILLANNFQLQGNFQTELNRDFPEFIVNETQNVDNSVTPSAFKVSMF